MRLAVLSVFLVVLATCGCGERKAARPSISKEVIPRTTTTKHAPIHEAPRPRGDLLESISSPRAGGTEPMGIEGLPREYFRVQDLKATKRGLKTMVETLSNGMEVDAVIRDRLEKSQPAGTGTSTRLAR